MGASIEKFNPEVADPELVYNFDLANDQPEHHHAIRVTGHTPLRAGNCVVKDLRHGATLICAALAASGTSTITGIEHVDRGYETLDERLRSMGAQIERVTI